ncbi:exocyst complex component 5-like [Tubulanus polymorphus]|uniref:exocyst complex component 5-like n=1 Tax=Tubulanus polymorphus TaxID=672921 RepID=UPI003DA53EE9
MEINQEELEQEPFDPEDYVERIAWRTTNLTKGGIDDFDPDLLIKTFEKTIAELKDYNTKIEKRSEKLEALCKEQEKNHWQKIAELHKNIQTTHTHFQDLDERINYVATKVVHLGDQLEGVNIPRARAVEAQKLMNYFSEFLTNEPLKSDVFTDAMQVHLAADIIQKLYLISQELPQDSKFQDAKTRISAKYDDIEKHLIENFVHAHNDKDKQTMKTIATTLSHFKGYPQCIDAFVEESQRGCFTNDVFTDVLPLCFNAHQLIQQVFINPEAVMAKFVMNIYQGKLLAHINSQLSNTNDPEKYLQNLNQLYIRTSKLSNELSIYNMGSDSTFLTKLTKGIFIKYLETYISMETNFLEKKSSVILARYYESKNHQKKQIQTGAIHEFRRDIHAKLGGNIETYGGETFLSQEVAINLLQEFKLAFKRCKNLSSQSNLPKNAMKIFEILVQFLITDHIDYALELGLQGIPIAEPKVQPEIYLFDVVGQANTIFHLFEKLFSDSLIPLVSSSPIHSDCLQGKRDLMELMENKMDTGIDRSLLAIVGWIKHILTTEQKKTDFKPEDDALLQMSSPPCSKVVKFVGQQLGIIRDSLDGKNVEAVLMEFGTRLHRVVYDHLLQFQYNSIGAMLAICDVNEYRRCVKEFKIPLISQLFDTLHALCNLLVVVPENLKQVCTGEQLAGLEKMVLQSFVQLRADYKTAKLANYFK